MFDWNIHMFYIILAIVAIFALAFIITLKAEDRSAGFWTVIKSIVFSFFYLFRFGRDTAKLSYRGGKLLSLHTQEFGQDGIDAFNSVGAHISANGGAMKFGTKVAAKHFDDIGANKLSTSWIDSIKEKETKSSDSK